MAEAGPAVIVAFVIAAILVVPAALSIAELGTAMPEAGGDYVFIERGLGPSFGTIAGLGTWLMLMLKGRSHSTAGCSTSTSSTSCRRGISPSP